MSPGLVNSLKARISGAVVQQLIQGLSPDMVALTVAIGFCLAVIPVVGVTTILCLAAAWALRLNQPIIQTINWLSYPLQLILILPFIRLGEKIFRAPRLTLSLKELVAYAQADPWGASVELSRTIGHAVVAWAVLIPFAGALIFLATRPLVRSLALRIAAVRRAQADEMGPVR